MLLDDISKALQPIGLPVFYGQAGTMEGADLWDYIVFWRDMLNPNDTKRTLSEQFVVCLVQENYCDDAKIGAVIKAVTAIPGVRVQSEGGTFEYMMKPNTDTVLESLRITFTRPFKVCSNV